MICPSVRLSVCMSVQLVCTARKNKCTNTFQTLSNAIPVKPRSLDSCHKIISMHFDTTHRNQSKRAQPDYQATQAPPTPKPNPSNTVLVHERTSSATSKRAVGSPTPGQQQSTPRRLRPLMSPKRYVPSPDNYTRPRRLFRF